MKRERLAPIEWPFGRPLELKRGTSFASMFDDMPTHVQDFLNAAIRARYLPSGVQMILVASVEPISSALSFSVNGLVAKNLDTVERRMSEVATWNKQHKRSFFQRITNEYSGGLGAVAVFQRGRGTAIETSLFHVAQFCFRDVTDTPPPFVAHPPEHYGALRLKDAGFIETDAPSLLPVTLRLSGAPITDDNFGNVARATAADDDYMSRIGTLIPYCNLVLADPRTLKGRPELQRRLGTLGLNVLLHPHVPITQELVTRVFLLVDRLNTLFHFSVVSHFEGELAGTSKAFRMMTHSLGNAIAQFPTMDEQLRSVLTVETWNMEGAKLLSTRGSVSRTQLITVDRGWVQAVLSRALDRPWETFSVDAACLDGLSVDPRFLAVLVELARNQRKASKTHTGSLEVTLLREGLAKVVALSDCDYRSANGLMSALTDTSATDDMQGVPILLLLFDLLCTEESTISYEIGAPPFRGRHVVVVRLPRSGARVSLRFGYDLKKELAKVERDADVCFSSRVVVDGVLVSGGTAG